MFDDSILSEPDEIIEIESPVNLTEINGQDNIFFNPIKTQERRVRTYIYNLLKEARKYLPPNYNFIVYEAYRPLSVQVEKWQKVQEKMHKEHPEMDVNSEEFISLCNVYIANPYRQGSGHQSGAAIDISLVDNNGKEYDMGCPVSEFGPLTETDSEFISETAKKNRKILKEALAHVGIINYPSEWWHYSFGDRLWARLTGSKLAIFGKLDL